MNSPYRGKGHFKPPLGCAHRHLPCTRHARIELTRSSQGTGFCQTYEQFLACRALFGVAMGGLYGNAAATALEDLPAEARGLMSGLLQQGYAFGYLLAAAFARALVNTTSHEWRPLFWFGACPPVLFIIWRLMLPETRTYREHENVRRAAQAAGHNITKTFIEEGKVAIKRHWALLVYLVLLMAGFNFMSHGSQDLYPTMLTNQYNFNANQVTGTQVVANAGAMVGGTVVGFCSQIFGRRFSIIVICVIGGALLYPYCFTSTIAIMAPAFFEQVSTFQPHPPTMVPNVISVVLRTRRLGRYSHPSDGAFAWCFPYLCRRYCLSAWQPCLFCFGSDRGHDGRALSPSPTGQDQPLRVRQGHLHLYGLRLCLRHHSYFLRAGALGPQL